MMGVRKTFGPVVALDNVDLTLQRGEILGLLGINTRRLFLLALILGGAIAGLAGGIEVAGVHRRLIEGLQSNFLLLGIIIGLIAKGNHLAVR